MSRQYANTAFRSSSQHLYCFNAEVVSIEDRHICITDLSDQEGLTSQTIQVLKSHCNAAIHDIRVGDRVSARFQSDTYVIEFRFQREQEEFLPLQYDAQGRLTLHAGKSLLLQTNNGVLSISDKGAVSIEGTELKQDFTQYYRVYCPSIAFN
ncbi:hypothetical protein [Marinomonas balearica]|uniref:Uncharacterized protein n=1 Tax=Marinomonas balearica TaxID=491947 RepID=A0A4R6M9T8_9GAMM|nr:hypothetical protein [Marinomonas balearica]TDO97400.1 hypothetical protein DFP79_2218 [Marinomonas balearica]